MECCEMSLLPFPTLGAAQGCYRQRQGHLHLILHFVLAQSYLRLLGELEHEEGMLKHGTYTLLPLAAGNMVGEDIDISACWMRSTAPGTEPKSWIKERLVVGSGCHQLTALESF